MSQIVVVDEILHDGIGLVAFRVRLASGKSARMIANRGAVGRAPVPGESWEIGGRWERHPDYGRQVAVETAALVRPSGRLLVEALSRNAAFPGIGSARALKLWEEHGDAVYELLDAGCPAPFEDLLGEELARVLISGWREIDADARTYRWLDEHGFPTALGRKLIAIYARLPVPDHAADEAARKGAVIWHLEDDPYRMLAFAPWERVDAAARQMGLQADDERRLVGAVEAVLARRLRRGDTWIPEATAAKEAAVLLGAPRARGAEALRKACERRAVVIHAGGVQAAGPHVMESFVEDRCVAMAEGRVVAAQRRLESTITCERLARVLDAFDEAEGYPLTPEQRTAVSMALERPVSALLGGPGVGKTTVLKAVHSAAEAFDRRVIQAALSGRAAQRMAEATGRPALTIASLLIRLDRGEIGLADEPLVVLDESSMIDLPTLYRLLRRFDPGARLLLVGDPGQLPPIGFGLTFHVLASDERIPRTVLSVTHRSTEESGIPAVCAAVRDGRVPALDVPNWARAGGVSFIEAGQGDITDCVIDVLERLGGADAAQVIGSVKRGPGGTLEINARLHALMAVGRRECAAGFREGEPVMMSRNDYDLGVMNGELGDVVGRDRRGGLLCRFSAGRVALPAASLGDLELAYAITCHKSQGSQFRRVVIPVRRNRLLDRTLLLTAISRAQEQVVLVGDRAAFEAAVAAPPGPSLRLVGLGRTLTSASAMQAVA